MSVEGRQESFDYSTCSFEVRLTKKRFLHNVLRYVYFSKDKLIICKEPYQKRPEKILELSSRFTIKWLYTSSKPPKNTKEKTIGFAILNEKEEPITQFYGDSLIMTCLLDFLTKQIFQADFLDEYEIIQKIGKGKYAKVYKVQRKDTKEFFAVKYLHKRKMKEIEDSEAALDNEINILRLIDHPNCLKLVACYQDQVGYYILTELLDESKSLSQEMAKYKNPQFSYQMVKHILVQLLRGLKYVHSKGIMHRDLKPQNIMFAQSLSGTLSQLKLIDFGLAQFVDSKKYIYIHVGTPGYVAPEILANESENHRYDEKCDLFSIGVIFHTLLTGKTVFPGNKFSQVLEKNKLCQIQLTGPKYEQISSEALDLMSKLLQKDPVQRISASDALTHSFFEDKGMEVDKMPSCIDAIEKPKTREEIILPRRPIRTHGSLQESDFLAGASPSTITGQSLIGQLASLKSMKDINGDDETLVQTQIEALIMFTRDLLCLLADMEDNKDFLKRNGQEEDGADSPLKIQQKGLKITDEGGSTEGKYHQKMPILAELKKNKENSLANPIKLPESIEEEEENDFKSIPGDGKETKKSLFIETKQPHNNNTIITDIADKTNLNGIGTQNNMLTEEQGYQPSSQKQVDIQQVGVKIKYPPRNMILNEMPSPISPPVNFKLSGAKLQLRVDLNNKSAEKMNPGTGQEQSKLLPKEIAQLIDYFPKDMFGCYLRSDQKEIINGMKPRVFKLGLFLLFGEEVLKSPAPAQITQKLKEITQKKNFPTWFIDLIKSMLIEDEGQRPTIKQLSQQLLTNFPYSKS